MLAGWEVGGRRLGELTWSFEEEMLVIVVLFVVGLAKKLS